MSRQGERIGRRLAKRHGFKFCFDPCNFRVKLDPEGGRPGDHDHARLQRLWSQKGEGAAHVELIQDALAAVGLVVDGQPLRVSPLPRGWCLVQNHLVEIYGFAAEMLESLREAVAESDPKEAVEDAIFRFSNWSQYHAWEQDHR
jgi:hypothetical protein